jgi:endonuclease-3 related protein
LPGLRLRRILGAMDTSTTLMRMHEAMGEHFGPLHWWPGRTPFEVMVGAVLTQNTSWKNVEKAIANLDAAGVLEPHAIDAMAADALAALIRPAGYYNVKSVRLKSFVRWFVERFDGDAAAMAACDGRPLRQEVLAIRGIGRETADSILLYACGMPVFVVDKYTWRILARHLLINAEDDYDAIQQFFTDRLPADVPLYNEYHAQLVNVGKEFCRPTARCAGCPLERFEHRAEEV